MATLQKFPAFSFLEHLPDAVFTGVVANANLTVTFNNRNIVYELPVAPDSTGKVVVPLKQMLRRMASFAEPLDTGAVWNLPRLQVRLFDGTSASGECLVVLGGLSTPPVDQSAWCATNFLTGQPQIIETTQEQRQWLALAVPSTSSVEIQSTLYTVEGDIFSKWLINASGRMFNIIRTDFAYLWEELCASKNVTPISYDVFGTGTFVQRYMLRQKRYNDICFLFENTLGGLDSLMMAGRQSYQPEGDVESFQNLELEREVYNDYTSVWEANTGVIETEGMARQFQDFFKSAKRWVVQDGVTKRIIVTEYKLKHIRGEANSYTFKYHLSEKNELRNIERRELPTSPLPPAATYDLKYTIEDATPKDVVKRIGDGVTITLKTPEELGMTLPWNRVFKGWYLNGALVTEITVTADTIIEGQTEVVEIIRPNLARETRYMYYDGDFPDGGIQYDHTTGLTRIITDEYSYIEKPMVAATYSDIVVLVNEHQPEGAAALSFDVIGVGVVVNLSSATRTKIPDKIYKDGILVWERETGGISLPITTHGVSRLEFIYNSASGNGIFYGATFKTSFTKSEISKIKLEDISSDTPEAERRATAWVKNELDTEYYPTYKLNYMFRDANGQDHTVSEFHAQGSIVELKTLEQLGFNLADGYEFSGWREQGQVPVTSVIMSSDTYVAGVETAIIKPTLSLDKVPVGFNLRGTTWRIDKTIPIPTDGQVRGSAEIPALTFGAGSLLAIANGNTQLAIIISNSTVETNEGNQLVIAYVNWYYTGDTFTIKDDRDYIVTENNLWTGDANNWGFENITQI